MKDLYSLNLPVCAFLSLFNLRPLLNPLSSKTELASEWRDKGDKPDVTDVIWPRNSCYQRIKVTVRKCERFKLDCSSPQLYGVFQHLSDHSFWFHRPQVYCLASLSLLSLTEFLSTNRSCFLETNSSDKHCVTKLAARYLTREMVETKNGAKNTE